MTDFCRLFKSCHLNGFFFTNYVNAHYLFLTYLPNMSLVFTKMFNIRHVNFYVRLLRDYIITIPRLFSNCYCSCCKARCTSNEIKTQIVRSSNLASFMLLVVFNNNISLLNVLLSITTKTYSV